MTRAALTCAALLALLLGAAACSVVKTNELNCSNCDDDDDDGLTDCEDPDCQALARCSVTTHCDSLQIPPAPPPKGEDAATPSSRDASAMQGKPPIKDAGRPPEDSGEPMSMPDDEDSGGLPPDPGPCADCAPDEACVNDVCQPAAAPTGGHYLLSVLSASVPTMDRISFCYDRTSDLGLPCIAGFCTCSPDPYVRVVLDHAGEQIVLGMTEPVAEEIMPVFAANTFELNITPGDVLRFEVFDADNPDDDDLLFTCAPDLSTLDMSPLHCVWSSVFGFEVVASITPTE